ncbi:hypothetical protein BLNAU_15869 [Blattamonas nauphoetae]|uniref:Uncharacterized protein n=1 Tax=Blattamonas nauphoetae TaxID=2049346 RepID=A0ABQ9XD03_9EUKA|nr:hypothetical protein BLNAU_15869 [Blattamonas nauphoetae]
MGLRIDPLLYFQVDGKHLLNYGVLHRLCVTTVFLNMLSSISFPSTYALNCSHVSPPLHSPTLSLNIRGNSSILNFSRHEL